MEKEKESIRVLEPKLASVLVSEGRGGGGVAFTVNESPISFSAVHVGIIDVVSHSEDAEDDAENEAVEQSAPANADSKHVNRRVVTVGH